jgi:thiosulfate/3-mercaptopyruvate sulfurtransferase
MIRSVLALIAAAFVAAACAPAQQTGGPSVASNAGFANPKMLIETDELATALNQSNVRIVDMRTKEKYAAGHIPGAVNLDTSQLKDPDDKLYAPTSQNFSKLMSGAGISNETQVIAYDDNGGLGPARLWWVLDYYGHTNARIVNGGWNKWAKENRPTDTAVPSVPATQFTAKLNPDTVCALDYVQSNAKRSDVVIVDARTAGEYNGTDVRAARGGHIPGSINIDWQRNVTNDDVKAWKPAGELRQMYESAGVTPAKEVITYCQTAVRAAHTLFTLKLLGYGKIKNYDGSWAEYGNRQDTQIGR